MSNSDERRWQQRLDNCGMALAQLTNACNREGYDDLEYSGLIKTFEFCFELSWDVLRDLLFYEGFEAKVPRTAIRRGFEVDNIDESDCEILLDALSKRNLLSHTYRREVAQEMQQLIKEGYQPRPNALLPELGRKGNAMMDGLKDTHREAIIAEIATNNRVKRAVLFGSRATGTNTVSSDVDIALFGDRLTLTDQARLASALDRIPMAQSVDLILYDSIRNRSLRHHIRSQGVEWFARPSTRRGYCVAPPLDTRDPAPPEDWSIMPFNEAFLINPTVPIERGTPTPFVDMAAVDPGVRAVRSTRVRKFRGSGSRFRDGDTLFARITPCLENGKIARYYANSDLDVGHGSTEFIVVRGRPGVTDSEYAFYVTLTNRVRGYAIGQMTGTSGRQRVPPGCLGNLDVAVPTISKQRAIAHVLGTLDDKIESNQKMNETLEAMACALFKSWFVNFDPVRAKIEGQDTGLPDYLADSFPDHLVDSELGQIPEGWTVATLKELMEVNPKRLLPRGQIAPYLPMRDMPTRGHVPDSVSVRPFGSGTRFANGDTLVARITPCLENGKTAYVDFLHDEEVGWGSTEYIVLKPRNPLPDQFAYCLARSVPFREFAVQNMSGTSGRQRVPVAALKGFLMVTPPAELASQFGKAAGSLLGRANWAVRESRTLAALRDTLLPKLISGEIRVQKAERIVGSVK